MNEDLSIKKRKESHFIYLKSLCLHNFRFLYQDYIGFGESEKDLESYSVQKRKQPQQC